MTKEEIRQKAIECGRTISQNCGKPCVECEYGEYFYGDIPCLTVNGYEHGFADGVEEGKRLASEKQIPKKIGVDGYGWYECPECHNKRPNWLIGKDAKWCPYCGQRIDWTEGEEA